MRAVALAFSIAACGDNLAAPVPDAASTGFELVGHSDLDARGMNSALAVAGDFVYVGSRTDAPHPHAGVLIVDAHDPAHPTIAGELGPPDEDLIDMSSRELRADPDRHLLFVLEFSCAKDLHRCSTDLAQFGTTGGAAETDRLKIYDLADPRAPKRIGTYDFGSYPGHELAKPHEMFLWRGAANRELMYVTTPGGPPSLEVIDVSDPTAPALIATWDPSFLAPPRGNRGTGSLHSLSISDDGRTAYLAISANGFMMLDTSELAVGVATPTIRELTPEAARLDQAPPLPPSIHSAVVLPGRSFVLLTSEIYEKPISTGCPWGWVSTVDISDPAAPAFAGDFELPENDPANCEVPTPTQQQVFTAHNPTLTSHLAFVTWHAGGLLALDTTDATHPREVTRFVPDPIPQVATEDPTLGGSHVSMWSYPVIVNGLIYVVDIRNGLYVLRYHGPHDEEIARTRFDEGNSNLR
ncbi:MAG TPA: hypothetical protein VL463_15635 [Kofleriaceae bacterium]|nr:hypothetical protein [Kofleriaceae bacterium]